MKNKIHLLLVFILLLIQTACKDTSPTPFSTSTGKLPPTKIVESSSTALPTSTPTVIPPTSTSKPEPSVTDEPIDTTVTIVKGTVVLKDCTASTCATIEEYQKGDGVTFTAHADTVSGGITWLQAITSDGKSGYIKANDNVQYDRGLVDALPDFERVMPTPIPPFDYTTIGMPLDESDILIIVANYGCKTSGTDGTHDGLDIKVKKNERIPVYAVADGLLSHSDYDNTIGYQVTLILGKDEHGQTVRARYVHLDEVENGPVKKGDVIGYIFRPHGGGFDHILYFAIRIGEQARRETPNDGTPGDEVDITNLLIAGWPDAPVEWDNQSCR